jgi:hypothetical protein
MKNERLIGFILLFLGLILIVGALCLVCFVFTGATRPPQLFKMQSITVLIPTGTGASGSIQLLPGEVVSRLFNMAIWYIFMLFVLSAGGKIAGLGVQLLTQSKVSS